MKVSIDSIISTAKRMRGEKQLTEKLITNRKKEEIGLDSVEIINRINFRLVIIQNDLNKIQSSLTKNQMIKEGINQVIEDEAKGGKRRETILDELMFEDEMVLRDFLGDKEYEYSLQKNFDRVDRLIEEDISKLKSLQIEVENIVASDLASTRIEGIIENIESALSRIDSSSLINISDLRADMVMTLIQ